MGTRGAPSKRYGIYSNKKHLPRFLLSRAAFRPQHVATAGFTQPLGKGEILGAVSRGSAVSSPFRSFFLPSLPLLRHIASSQSFPVPPAVLQHRF
ncbi:uncharacterized protein TrAtP1_012281 [Trichoderma atroviride]|uniref:uncharacterized protein n=1 Tax=Hypocrea atroviridis TaxID=63577 RepID=UPI0033306136|nr:hypothetical protein TrAtP1_012281 [Trichoderma atroviride]